MRGSIRHARRSLGSKRCRLEQTGLPIRHALRHSSIVRMFRARVPVRLVAAQHDTSSQMVEGHYSSAIVDLLDDLLAGTAISFLSDVNDGNVALRTARPMKRNARSIRSAYLMAMVDHGDVEGVYRHTIFLLRRSGNPELRVLARILSRKVQTGVTAIFCEGRGRRLRMPTPIATKQGPMSRRNIARLVFDMRGRPETGDKIAYGRLGDTVGSVARELEIGDAIVRRCFNEHRISLAAEASFSRAEKRVGQLAAICRHRCSVDSASP